MSRDKVRPGFSRGLVGAYSGLVTSAPLLVPGSMIHHMVAKTAGLQDSPG